MIALPRCLHHILARATTRAFSAARGELFRVKELSARTDQYPALVKKAGIEYAQGGISDQTKPSLKSCCIQRYV